MPRASIVITTHNRLELLKKCISSGLSAGDVEVIVVDDASTDGTQAYCNSLNAIRYIRLDKNIRTAGARNAGIGAAATPYVAFLDDDDLRLPGTIDRQIEVLENDVKCAVVYGRFFQSDEHGKYDETEALPPECPEGDVIAQLLRGNFIGLSTSVVRKSAVEGVGMFDPSPAMYGIEDWDLWLRLAEKYPVRALCEPVAIYRMPVKGTGQWSSDIASQFGRVAEAYKSKWFHLPRVRDILREGKITKSQLLAATAQRILYDMSTNSSGAREKTVKIIAALRCQPSQLGRLSFYKTLVKSLIG